MKSLLVDAGNSSIKWAVLSSGLISIQQKRFYEQETPLQKFESIVKENKNCNAIILVSVLDDQFSQQAKALAALYSCAFYSVNSQKEIAGITNAYLDPYKLGTDRLVAMVAAYHLINNEKEAKQACLVIDAGTATTIDAVDNNGQHLGGLILPGSDLCSRSLLNNTALLSQRSTEKTFSPNLFSKETTQAISSASIIGLAGAIENICLKMEKEFSTPVQRILCGGNATILLPFMESSYEHQQDLLMQGLKIVAETSHWISDK